MRRLATLVSEVAAAHSSIEPRAEAQHVRRQLVLLCPLVVSLVNNGVPPDR
jgi:hypothetical protein